MEEEKEKVIDGQEEKDQEQKEEKQEETKTYSEDEVKKMLQSETDKRVSQAIQTAKEKWQKEYEEKLEQEKNEAEKLAKMSESERQEAQLQKMKEEFETERKQFQREKLELQTVKELSSLGLPTEFSTYVMADTADQIQENIKGFKSQWETAIEKAVNEKLKGTTPKSSTKAGSTVSKEQFQKMNYQERLKLYNEDPELYSQLKG